MSDRPPTILIDPDAPAQQADFIRQLVTLVWDAAADLIAGHGAEVPRFTVVIADDFAAARAEERTRLGVGPELGSGIEQLGPVTSTRCWNAAGDEVSVIATSAFLNTEPATDRLLGALLVAHQMGHVLYETVADAQMGAEARQVPEAAPLLPALLARQAVEEYRAGRLGYLFCAAALGYAHPGDLYQGAAYASGLGDYLDLLHPGLSQLVDRHLAGQITTADLWSELVRLTHEALTLAARIEAEADAMGRISPLVESVEHPAILVVLDALWTPLRPLLHERPLLPAPGQWVEDRDEVNQVGAASVEALWAQLGVRMVPDGDLFTLLVTEPTL